MARQDASDDGNVYITRVFFMLQELSLTALFGWYIYILAMMFIFTDSVIVSYVFFLHCLSIRCQIKIIKITSIKEFFIFWRNLEQGEICLILIGNEFDNSTWPLYLFSGQDARDDLSFPISSLRLSKSA